jgi:hypothetical protein
MTGRVTASVSGDGATEADADHDDRAGSIRPADIANAAVPKRDRHTWSLFEDWCTAHDEPPLAASPESLARFLHAHPAASTTQRRRIAVIDAAHSRHLLPPPGRAEAVRAALDVARTARLHELAAVIGGIIARLPESGWPSALFARRDALVLVVASTGLPYTQIAALRACDVTADPRIDALRIDSGRGVHILTSLALTGTGISPRMVYQRWLEVLGHHARYPSTRMLADALDAVGGTGIGGYDRYVDSADRQPLSTAIDRWGHTPLTATPLTSRAVADIVRAHLDGRAPTRLQPTARSQQPERIAASDPVPRLVLDPGYYERGTLARRHAHGLLDDVDSVLADVETRADSLLEALVDFLESETTRVPADIVE